MAPPDYDSTGIEYYTIPSFKFKSGLRMPVKVAYRAINPSSPKTILIPTCYGGLINDTLSFTSPPLTSLTSYHVVIVSMLGCGESSSPSNDPSFPPSISYIDCINSQYLLLTNRLQITSLEAVIGFSMGGQQAYYWAVMHGSSPSPFVKNIVSICSAARTSPHNYAFLEGPFAALEASADYVNGEYVAKGIKPIEGLRAFGRAYAAWLTSPEWFHQELWGKEGFGSLKEWLFPPEGKGPFDRDDARDLLVTGRMWQSGDVGEVLGGKEGDWEKAMRGVQSRVLVMPSRTDQYFRWEDSVKEVRLLKHGKLEVIESIWGHIGGGGANEEDSKWMDEKIKEFLNGENRKIKSSL